MKNGDLVIATSVLESAAKQVGLVIGKEFTARDVRAERAHKRPAGRESIHISFKLAFTKDDRERYGCVLVPLAEAISLASYLLMVPDEAVLAQRDKQQLDDTLKDAMLEVGNFIGGAVAGVLRTNDGYGCDVRPRGCQGVRPDVRPAFPYREGDPLLVARCTAQLHTFAPFEMIAVVPLFETKPAPAT